MYNYFWNVDTKEYSLYDRAGNKVATLHGFPHEQTEFINTVLPVLDSQYKSTLDHSTKEDIKDAIRAIEDAARSAEDAAHVLRGLV